MKTRDIDDANRIIQTLVGTSTQDFRNALEPAVGFDLWYQLIRLDQPKKQKFQFIGIQEQNADQLRGLLKIAADQNEINNVEISAGRAIFVQLPNQSNWLQTWTVLITESDAMELRDDYVKSDKMSLTVSEFVKLEDDEFSLKPIIGQEIGLKVHTIDEFREKYRKVYDLWRHNGIFEIDQMETSTCWKGERTFR